MTWIRQQIAPSPHTLDPKLTVGAAKSYASRFTPDELRRIIADHERAAEHERAVLEGLYQSLEGR